MFSKSAYFIRKSFQIAQILKRNAGHSKWANIKHIKAVKDQARSALFTRLSRQIKVAIQEGGSTDSSKNLKLEQVIEQCKRANMPIGTIQNVIKCVEQRKEDCKTGLVDIKGPNGLIILIEVFTNNLSRCKMNIATVIKKYNASLSNGAGQYKFERKGIIETQTLETKANSDEILELATEHAIETGAEDVKLISDDILQYICEANSLRSVQKNLENLKYNIISASVEYVPKLCVEVDENELEKMSVMFEKLENCEDVIKLHDNIG